MQGGELERIDLHKSVGDVFVDSFLEQLFDDLIDPLRTGDGKRQLPNLLKRCFFCALKVKIDFVNKEEKMNSEKPNIKSNMRHWDSSIHK